MQYLAHPTFVTAALLMGLCSPPDASAEPLTIHHLPTVPLAPDGAPALPMGRHTADWATKAGFTVRWTAVPLKRSLLELQTGREAFCVMGVFSNPERRLFARFSLPISLGEQQVFLATAAAAARLRELPNAEAALHDVRFKLLAFEGVTYGEVLDRWIAHRPQAPHWTNPGTARLLPMLQHGRVDFTISVASEVQALQAESGSDGVRLEAVLLPGMPSPPSRHLACSHRVPQQWLERFDAAVRADPPH